MTSNEPSLVDLLGMDRVIRRAYETATAENVDAVRAWHDAEEKVARDSFTRRQQSIAGWDGLPSAAWSAWGVEPTNVQNRIRFHDYRLRSL